VSTEEAAVMVDAGGETANEVLAMRRVTWVHRAGFVAFVLVFGAAAMRVGLGGDWPWPGTGWQSLAVTWGAPGLMLAVLVAGAVRRAYAVPAHPTLVLGARAAVLPPGRFGRRTRTMPYDTIRSVAWAPSWLGRRARLGVGDDRGAVAYYRAHWFAPGALAAFAEQLRARVDRADPTGGRRAALRARAGLAEAAAGRAPRATATLIALIFVTLTVQWAAAPFDPPYLLWEGATARWLMGDGGWYRLFTGPMLHAGLAHAAANVVMIALIGPLVEGLLGTARTVLVASLAAIAGSLAFVAFEGVRGNVGASGAAYGLVGALLALNVVDRRALPPPYWLSPALLAALLATVVLIDWLVPESSSVIHVAGMLGGALAACALRRGSLLAPAAGSGTSVAAWALAGSAVLGFALAGRAALRAAAAERPEDVVRRTALAFASPDSPPLVFDAWAGILAGMPGVRRVDLLDLAPIASARGRATGDEAAEIAGEIAWLLGDADAALAHYERAARDDPSAWQLERLAAHRHRAWAAGDIVPERFGTRLGVDAAGGVTLELDEASPGPFVIDALVIEAGRLHGALRVEGTAAPAGTIESRAPVLPPATTAAADHRRRLVVVAFTPGRTSTFGPAAIERAETSRATQTTGEPAVGRGTLRWSYQPVGGAAATLPSPLSE
jgi:membrane associated rhomboid family serine protease